MNLQDQSHNKGKYLDFLDSAKSAHTEKYSPEWWRPDTVEDQNNSIEFARAEMMLRILHGDTIVLSNNQATDSVAWLTLASSFSQISLPWETLSLAFFEVAPASPAEAIKDIIVNYFSNPEFSSSAWTGLDDKLRALVLSNITKDSRPLFHRMLSGVTKSIADSNLAQALEAQATGLHLFYEYLLKNESRMVSFVAKDMGSYVWPKLEALSELPGGISKKTLTHIKQKLKNSKALEKRSLLYNAIEDIDPPEREEVRKYIDFFYNEKMGLSVSKGRGVYTISDHDEAISPIRDEEMASLADSTNSPVGLLGNNVLQIRQEKFKDYLSWDDFLHLIQDDEFKRSANFLRRMVEEFDTLPLSGDGYFREYNNWLGKTFEALNNHQDFLAEALKRKSAKGVNGFVLKIGPWLGAGAGAIVGAELGSHLVYGMSSAAQAGSAALGATAGGTIMSELVSDLLKERGLPAILASTASGKIRASLRDAVSIRSDEALLKRRK
ncbi:MAG: hypothetical protein KJZ53_04455 [Anaerolineales bacterium]|nr:hypothetical protein [Anaerolineales bacterium]